MRNDNEETRVKKMSTLTSDERAITDALRYLDLGDDSIAQDEFHDDCDDASSTASDHLDVFMNIADEDKRRQHEELVDKILDEHNYSFEFKYMVTGELVRQRISAREIYDMQKAGFEREKGRVKRSR